jgi:hypothetical protein
MAAVLAAFAVATPAAADGQRRVWRGPAYAGAVSRNVITPWYVGYYPSHYSYYRPTPMPRGYYDYPRVYRDGCWVSVDGYIGWAC